MIREGKSKVRQSKAVSSGTADAQGFALYTLGKEKLELAEGILEAVISVSGTAKVQTQG